MVLLWVGDGLVAGRGQFLYPIPSVFSDHADGRQKPCRWFAQTMPLVSSNYAVGFFKPCCWFFQKPCRWFA
jgi:hypothetical protein